MRQRQAHVGLALPSRQTLPGQPRQQLRLGAYAEHLIKAQRGILVDKFDGVQPRNRCRQIADFVIAQRICRVEITRTHDQPDQQSPRIAWKRSKLRDEGLLIRCEQICIAGSHQFQNRLEVGEVIGRRMIWVHVASILSL